MSRKYQGPIASLITFISVIAFLLFARYKQTIDHGFRQDSWWYAGIWILVVNIYLGTWLATSLSKVEQQQVLMPLQQTQAERLEGWDHREPFVHRSNSQPRAFR